MACPSRCPTDGYIGEGAQIVQWQNGGFVDIGDVVVVRGSIEVDATTDGGEVAHGSAPRRSTFHYEDGTWRISSHANLAPIE